MGVPDPRVIAGAEALNEHMKGSGNWRNATPKMAEVVLRAADAVSGGEDRRCGECNGRRFLLIDGERRACSCYGSPVSGVGEDREDQNQAELEWSAYAVTLNQRLERVEVERDRLKRRVEFTEQWYAVRFERIKDEAKKAGIWPAIACIMANGTAEMREPPTYDQQMNVLRHERDRLREALDLALQWIPKDEMPVELAALAGSVSDKDRS